MNEDVKDRNAVSIVSRILLHELHSYRWNFFLNWFMQKFTDFAEQEPSDFLELEEFQDMVIPAVQELLSERALHNVPPIIIAQALYGLYPAIQYLLGDMPNWAKVTQFMEGKDIAEHSHDFSDQHLENYCFYMSSLYFTYMPNSLLWKQAMAGKRVLDLGCGAGHYLGMMVDNDVAEYVGIDRQEMLDAGEKHNFRERLASIAESHELKDVEFFPFDFNPGVNEIPPDLQQAFDVLFLSEILHSQPNIYIFLDSCLAFLRTKGERYIIINELSTRTIESSPLFKLHLQMHGRPGGKKIDLGMVAEWAGGKGFVPMQVETSQVHDSMIIRI